jgi:MHS family proline/betaine transporter-like MFS transporter
MKNNWKTFIPACVAGNILELYEFIIYGYFATIIASLFFPSQDKYTSLFATFAVFATGCLVRPFSAILLGYVGDKRGRRISLIISIGIMAISTLGIGLLPTYSQIGIAAPMLLLLFRIGQGLSMTSEEIGAALFLMENAPKSEKGYASCFTLGSVYIGLFFGSIVSALVFSVFHEPALSSWGWRIPFILGGTIGLVTLIIRIKQPESYEFNEAVSNNAISTNPLIDLFKKNKFSVFRITLLCSLFAVAVYLFAVYIPNTMNIVHIVKYEAMLICSLGFLLAFSVSLLVGKHIDKIGSKIPILISTVGFFLFSYPIFYLLSMQSLITIIIAYGLFAILLGMSAGSIMYDIMKCFPVNTRFSGSCISFNLSMSIFGGTAPLLGLYLTKLFHTPTAPAFLLMVTAILTLFAVFTENEIIEENTYDYKISYQNG